MVVDDHDTGEVHFLGLLVRDVEVDRAILKALVHNSELDFLCGSLDVSMHANMVELVGTQGIHKVYVLGTREVYLVGEDASEGDLSRILSRLERAMLSETIPSVWWRDYRLVRAINGKARKARDIESGLRKHVEEGL